MEMGDQNLGRMSAAEVRALIGYNNEQWLFLLVRDFTA